MNRIILTGLISFILILTGCSFGQSTESSLNDVLTKVYEDEEGYRTAQEQLSELEKTEQASYNELMELTQKEKEEISAKTADMDSSLKERLSLINKEKESISKAEESFKAFDDVMKDAKEENIKGILEEMKKEMGLRFELHGEFTDQYEKLAELQKTLYGMLSDEHAELPKLQEKVAEVNAQNETVQSVIAEFNEHTKKFNELKNDVYEKLNGENNE